LEVDLVARYLERLIGTGQKPGGAITEDYLAEHGFGKA
jgi:hypothetical protein